MLWINTGFMPVPACAEGSSKLSILTAAGPTSSVDTMILRTTALVSVLKQPVQTRQRLSQRDRAAWSCGRSVDAWDCSCGYTLVTGLLLTGSCPSAPCRWAPCQWAPSGSAVSAGGSSQVSLGHGAGPTTPPCAANQRRRAATSTDSRHPCFLSKRTRRERLWQCGLQSRGSARLRRRDLP